MNPHERVYALINLDNFKNNIREIIKHINKDTAYISVIKADGYGHGAFWLAEASMEAGAEMLAVAIAEEAIELRNSGILAPILVMGAALKSSAEDLIRLDVCQTIFTMDMARYIDETALGKKAQIMIKVDTGMGRIGFLPTEESAKDILEIMKLRNLRVTGIYSHLACADLEDKTYSNMQNTRFSRFLSLLKEKGVNIPFVHISNSGGTIEHRELDYDAVRVGISQYGYFSSGIINDSVGLKPVMSIISRVSHVKTIAPGECVSYQCRFKAERETVVATIPVGYADGYSRKMINGGRVIIRGEYAPVIGRVCMDQFMVDVTDISGEVRVDDEAVLMGASGGKEVTAYEIAEICETIVHEVLCGVSKRVPRVLG